jgi:glycosyltransferase involved in cell wall biosynthesis
MEINRKKVLLVCDSSGTLLDFRGKLIEELLVSNDVYVFSPKITQPAIKERLLQMGVSVFENDLRSSNVSILSDLQYIKDLFRIIKLIKPDIFFPYAFKPVIYGSLVANFCGIKRITPMLTGLGYNFSNNSGKNGLVSKITKILLKLSLRPNRRFRVIFQNYDDCEKLITTGIINKKHQCYVVNGSGVDLSHYDYTEPQVDHLSFLMISRLINAKGINEYFEAARLIRQKFPETSFKLIGSFDDNIDAIDQNLYEKICSGETIEYLGPVTDVRPYIRDSSIVVLPSYYGEGVPRCILEGMAMGRAIITSNSVGCKETINDASAELNGFLVPVKNARALASRMEYFIKNTKDIIRFGLNGRKFAKEKFDVNLINSQMLHIIQGA